MPEMLDPAATVAPFNGLIQNATGTWSSKDEIKPLIISSENGKPLVVTVDGINEPWPPKKGKFISEVAATIYAGNECPIGQESYKAQHAIKRAEVLYNALSEKGYIK